MRKTTIMFLVAALLIGLTALWTSSHAASRMYQSHGPLLKAHFIGMGQANATLLEFKCGAVLIDAGAQEDEHVDGLVDFITSVFDARPKLDSTLEAVYVTHNHIDHNMARVLFLSLRLRGGLESQLLAEQRIIDASAIEKFTPCSNPRRNAIAVWNLI